MSMSDDNKRPIDILVDGDGFRALYTDGTVGPMLTINEMMDTLPHVQWKEESERRRPAKRHLHSSK
jgi:hypothetical protein